MNNRNERKLESEFDDVVSSMENLEIVSPTDNSITPRLFRGSRTSGGHPQQDFFVTPTEVTNVSCRFDLLFYV